MTEPPDTFVPRPYADIVRDLLTTLTGGTVRETATVPAGPVLVLNQLANRPIRRVSHLQGEVEIERPVRDAQGNVVLDGNGDPERETVAVPYRFTDTDFELVASGGDGAEPDAIRFRPKGRKPPVGSTVTVNYYPAQTVGLPITDLNVGSVSRTMLEAVGRELALTELSLEHVYRSAFLETAEGANLDKVVALVGVTRRPAGIAMVRVRFPRAPGSTGRVTIPAGTVVADPEGNRFATVAPLVLEPGEPSREVLAAGRSRSTPAVAAGAIDRLEVLVAGVAPPSNAEAAAPAAAAETDDELRRRARGALAVAARGTLDALRFGILAVPGVKDVTVVEFPHGVSGEIRVDVAYERADDAEAEAAVRERIEDLRPAGVRVDPVPASSLALQVSVVLTLAGEGVPASALGELEAGLQARVAAFVRSLPPGGTLRQAQVATVALADPRIVDASFEFTTGGPPSSSVTAPEGRVLQPVEPFRFDVSTESGAAAPGLTIRLDAAVPIHLEAGVTAAEAEQAIQLAASSFASGLAGGEAVTVDGLIAAVTDHSRYVVVRTEVTATTEADGRFLRLADGQGSHPVGPSDQVVLGTLHVDVREGGA